MSRNKRFLVDTLPTANRSSQLSKEETDHAKKVLRLKDGDRVEVIDGEGGSVQASLRFDGRRGSLEFIEITDREAPKTLPITLAMAILKGDSMEWVIEKSVELGVNKFVPLLTDRVVINTKSKGPDFFQQRWKKIADQSLKQCGRLTRMHVEKPQSMEEWMTQDLPSDSVVHWCNESSLNAKTINNFTQAGEIIILIGPEGGWSEDESTMLINDKRVTEVSLGPAILRAETAALFSISVISASLRFDT